MTGRFPMRYAETVAIRLAVEVLTGMQHPGARHPMESPYSTAAWHLGARGRGRRRVLRDLVAIMSLHGYQPIGTIRRALHSRPVVG